METLFKSLIDIFKNAIGDFFRDDVISLGAALAFFTVLSLAPLVVILVFVGGLIGMNAQQHLVEQIGILVGPGASNAISLLIQDAANRQITGKISALIGAFFLIYISTFAFAQLTKSLNKIWGVHGDVHPLRKLLRESLVSLGMIMALVILLILSLVAHTTITMFLAGAGFNWHMVHMLISIFMFTLLIAMVFKFLPAVKVAWGDTWVGSFVTAVLIVLGNIAFGKYMRYSSVASAYGAAASLIMLLMWVYYCSLIVFFGAEIMQARLRKFYPDKLPPKY